jgi:hypothetical protein
MNKELYATSFSRMQSSTELISDCMSFLTRHLRRETQIRNSYLATTTSSRKNFDESSVVDESEQLNNVFMFYNRMNQQSSIQQSFNELCHEVK